MKTITVNKNYFYYQETEDKFHVIKLDKITAVTTKIGDAGTTYITIKLTGEDLLIKMPTDKAEEFTDLLFTAMGVYN